MTAMDESDLDSVYSDLCRAISEVGEDRAPLLLARFALLAINEIGDVERVRRILASARAATREPADVLESDGGASLVS